MAPRLERFLSINSIRKASEPLQTRKSLRDICKSVRVNDVRNVLHVWMVAGVIIDSSQLDDLTQKGDVSDCAEILVADNGLGDSFGLVLGGSQLQEEVEGFEGSVELK